MAYIAERTTGVIADQCDGFDYLAIDRMISDAQASGYGVVFYEVSEGGDVVIWVD